MPDWDGDEVDDFADFISDLSEEPDVDPEELEDLEGFLEDLDDIGDMSDYDGPTIQVTISLSSGDDMTFTIPAEYIPDIIELANDYDVEIDFESE